MSDITSTESGGSEEADESADASRWNNRPEHVLADDITQGGGLTQPTPQPPPEPSRNPDRDWGVVLAAAGAVVLMLAAVIIFSVVMGGLVGLLTVTEAVALTVVLAVLGAIGLYRGLRIYQGR